MPVHRKISMLIGFSILLMTGLLLYSAFQRGTNPPPPQTSQPQPIESQQAPQGPPLIPATAQKILDDIQETQRPLTLLNIWATWCAPCREEFPALLQVRQKFKEKGLRLILVSADTLSQKNEAIQFLAEQGVQFPSYIKNEEDMAFISRLYPDWSGALPATLLYDQKGELVDFWQGAATIQQIEEKVQKHLPTTQPKQPKAE